MNKLKKQSHTTKLGVIFDWIARILAILAFLGISSSTIQNFVNRTWSTNWGKPVIWGLIFAAVIFVIVICKKNSYIIIKTAINAFSRNSRYRLIRWENIYEYLRSDEMQLRQEFEVKPLETGVGYIRTRYNWSGGDVITPEPITEEGFTTKKVEPDGKEFGYHFYRVYGKTFLNSDDDSFKLGVKVGNLKDVNKTASPHLLVNVNVETDLLVLKVILPHEISVQNVEYLEYLHATDDYHWHRYVPDALNSPVRIETITEGNKTLLIWEVKKPIFGGKYIIKWDPRVSS